MLIAFQSEAAAVALSKEREEKLLEQVNDLLKQSDCPAPIRATAKEVREKLTSGTSTPEERHEAAKRLAQQIDAFVLAFAKARPERPAPPFRGALPVPDDTPWAQPAGSKREKRGET
jgi:hypothetical protein